MLARVLFLSSPHLPFAILLRIFVGITYALPGSNVINEQETAANISHAMPCVLCTEMLVNGFLGNFKPTNDRMGRDGPASLLPTLTSNKINQYGIHKYLCAFVSLPSPLSLSQSIGVWAADAGMHIQQTASSISSKAHSHTFNSSSFLSTYVCVCVCVKKNAIDCCLYLRFRKKPVEKWRNGLYACLLLFI